VQKSAGKKMVSILLPVYNCGRYLRDALESLLSQTFQDFELLAIDDGSADNTAEILHSYQDRRLRVVHNERNLGLVKTLNRGLELAQGRYIARADADDIYLPERLEKQFSFIEQHPEFAAVGSWYLKIDPEGKRLGITKTPADPEAIRFRILTENSMAHPTMFFSREVANSLGGYSDLKLVEDWDLWSRMLSSGYKIANIPEALVKYRVHSENISLLCQSSIRRQAFSSMIRRNLKALAGIEVDDSGSALLYDSRFMPENISKDKIEPAVELCRDILKRLEESFRSREAGEELKRLKGILYLNLASAALNSGKNGLARSLYLKLIREGIYIMGALPRYGASFFDRKIVDFFRSLRGKLSP